MGKEIRGKRENNENNENSELNELSKTIMVNFKGKKKKYEFESSFLCGFLKDGDKDDVVTIINGFDDLDDFLAVFNNIILQAYDFLYNDGQNDKEKVVDALRMSADRVFNGVLTNVFDAYFSEGQRKEFD